MTDQVELTDRQLFRKADRSAAVALKELDQVKDRDLVRVLGYHVQRLYERAGWGRVDAVAALREAVHDLEERDGPGEEGADLSV